MFNGIFKVTEEEGSVFCGCVDGLDVKNGFLKVKGVTCVQFIQLKQIQRIEKIEPIFSGVIINRQQK